MSRISVAGIAIQGNRLFIARRLPGGDLGEKWEFPGGKTEDGETCEEALIREFREEFGIEVTPGPCIASSSFEHRGVVRKLRAFLVKFETPEITLREHSAWKWADFAEIETLDFADSDRKLFPALQEYAVAQPPAGDAAAEWSKVYFKGNSGI